jgi:hypothetical protein
MSHTWRGGASPGVLVATEAAPAICWSRLGWRGGTSHPHLRWEHATPQTILTHVRAVTFGASMLGTHTAWGSFCPVCLQPLEATSAVCVAQHFAPNVDCRQEQTACGSGRQRFVEKARPGVAPSLQNVVFRYRVYANFPGRVHLLRGAVAPSPVSVLE